MKHKKLTFSILFLLLFAVGYSIGIFSSTIDKDNVNVTIPKSSNSWLTGWNYRKNHTINSVTGAGMNYQVKFTVYKGSGIDSGENVYCEGNCLDNFADLRFTDNDGITELDYWMENYTTGSIATFWVKIQDDLSSNAEVCVYYGKNDSISTENFDETFPILSDDFEDGIIYNVPNNWYEVYPEPTGYFNITDDYVYDGEKSVKIYDGPTENSGGKRDVNGLSNCVFHTWYRAVDGRIGIVMQNQNSTVIENTPIQITAILWDETTNHWRYKTTGGMILDIPNWSNYVPGTWVRIEMFFRASDHKVRFIKNQNEDSGWLSSINSWSTVDYIILDANHNFPGTGWFDNIYIRKYSDPEPTHGLWFEEEYLDHTAPIITINQPQNADQLVYTPVYDISIDEANLDGIWYTIDGGLNNYTITELIGTIHSGAWSTVANGPVTIRFYARDLAGNIGTSFVIVVKTSEPPPGIPGYDLYLLIGALGVISIILIRKRLKS